MPQDVSQGQVVNFCAAENVQSGIPHRILYLEQYFISFHGRKQLLPNIIVSKHGQHPCMLVFLFRVTIPKIPAELGGRRPTSQPSLSVGGCTAIESLPFASLHSDD